MDPAQLKLWKVFVELATSGGFIDEGSSSELQQHLRNRSLSHEQMPNLISRYQIPRNAAQILWKLAQLAPGRKLPAPAPASPAENSGIASGKNTIKLEEIPEDLRGDFSFAQQLLTRGMVPIQKINDLLAKVQKRKTRLSLGQMLLREHLITPEQFVQLMQESKSVNANISKSCSLVHDPGTKITQLQMLDLKKIGRYDIIREIARGGMGIVYEVHDPQLDRVLALKTLLSKDERDVERFLREARMTANLHHPTIIAIHEVSSHDGIHYFTMDYIEGVTFSIYVRQTGATHKKIVKLLMAIVRALDYAHQEGVIHRDIKPQNILVDTQDRPLLTDFGLAKQQNAPKELTMSGVVLGTPTYMSPEQARGESNRIDVRSDIYSIGVVLYEALSGRPPFSGNSLLEIFQAVTQQDPVPLRQFIPGINRDLETICLKCLEKDRERRYINAKALLGDMELFLRNEPIRARSLTKWESALRWAKKHKITVAVTLTVLLLIIFYIGGKLSSLKEIEAARLKAVKQAEEAEYQAKKAERARAEIQTKMQEVQKERRQAERNLAQAWLYRGSLLNQLGKTDDALNAYARAIQLDSQLAQAYCNRGAIYLHKRMMAQALTDFNLAIRVNPQFAESYKHRGQFYMMCNKPKRALKDFSQALRYDTRDANSYGNRALAYLRLRQYHQAERDFSQALAITPDNTSIRFCRAGYYYEHRKYNQALSDYLYCAKNSPKYKSAEVKARIVRLRQLLAK